MVGLPGEPRPVASRPRGDCVLPQVLTLLLVIVVVVVVLLLLLLVISISSIVIAIIGFISIISRTAVTTALWRSERRDQIQK